MGLFSFYTGIIYNDWFSKSLNVFGSVWFVNGRIHTNTSIMEHHVQEKDVMLDPKNAFYDKPYPIGLDPVWQVAENKINFLNTYKMKISIIIGVVHMMFGVMLSLWNHIYFKRAVNILCEFIPQVLFMVFLFFYLCVLMFHKWIWYGANIKDKKYDEHCAPSILISFINMVLFKYGEDEKGCDPFMFPGQKTLQQIFVVVAVICVPWMLLIKPFVLQSEAKKKQALQMNGGTHHNNHASPKINYGSDIESGENSELPTPVDGNNSVASDAPVVQSSSGGGGGHGEHEEEFEMSEVFIHQGIHTIEYVLGSVSHTASYLRLWALSLAHARKFKLSKNKMIMWKL